MTLKGEWKAHLIWLPHLILLIYPITDIFAMLALSILKEKRTIEFQLGTILLPSIDEINLG